MVTQLGCWAVVQGSAGQVWLGSGSVLVLPLYQNDLVHPTLPLIFRRENVNHWLRSCVCAGGIKCSCAGVNVSPVIGDCLRLRKDTSVSHDHSSLSE